MKTLLAIALLALTVTAQHPVPVEIRAPATLRVQAMLDRTEPTITKYVINRKENRRPVKLTSYLYAPDGRLLHTHTDQMGRHAEVAWAAEAPVARLVLVVE